MALVCRQCGEQYDAALFGFGRAVRCGCGAWVDLAAGHVRGAETTAADGQRRPGLVLSSPAFVHHGRIPKRYTADGDDVSPPLRWEHVPEETAELVLVCDDPDAPTARPWVHWLVYGLSPQLKGLPEALPPKSRLVEPVTALQGRNSWHTGRTLGYRGPDPPARDPAHRYVFRLFAVDKLLRLGPGTDRETLLAALAGHVLAVAVLVGLYGRSETGA